MGKRKGNRNKPDHFATEDLAETRMHMETMDFRDTGPVDNISVMSNEKKKNENYKRERHPPGLKGKAIGMWYRNQNMSLGLGLKKLDKKKRKEEHEREPCIALCLDQDKEKTIRKLVDSIKTPLKMPIQTHIPERKIYTKKSRKELLEAMSLKAEPVEVITIEDDESKPMTIDEKYKHMEESSFKNLFLRNIMGSMKDNVDNALLIASKLSRKHEIDLELLEDMEKKQNNTNYNKMQEFRKKLPSWNKRQDLLDMVDKNQVIVISGETGCGKTTQVAQFILDNEIMKGAGSACHVVCTQPRRISAISVAERVAAERNETLGHGTGSVGYTIRLESKIPRPRGSILFCTTGILLRMLETDPALTEVSHLILDEIHERDTISDFAITILKDIIAKRSDLRVILMSATLNAENFSKYYENCAMINIPGFTFPVKEYYLEDVLEMTRFIPQDRRPKPQSMKWRNNKGNKKVNKEFKEMVHPYLREVSASKRYSKKVIDYLFEPESEEISLELITELIKYIDRSQGEGAILVFLPGWDKISTLNKLLKNEGMAESSRHLVIPLHSMLSTVSQRTIFDRPPKGVRKIVIATNIAETSITIDDVVFVIDCGKIKMKNFDVNLNITTLKEEWVSVANARQRKGRAGRVKDGVCYHLFTRAREQMLQSYPLPEMLRTRLEEVILQAKMLQLGSIKPFLSRVLDPPDPKAIDLSLKLLQDLNALDSDEHLTPLGYHLARLPMDPQTGKMILMGALFCVVDPIFSVAAGLSFKDPFTVPMEKEYLLFKKKKELAMGTKSDHLVLAEALTRWEAEQETNSGWRFAKEYFLSTSTLRMLSNMKNQFAQNLYEMKFLSTSDVKGSECNQNSQNIGLVKAIICAGLYPNVAIIRNVKKNYKTGRVAQKIFTPEDGRVFLHMRSINQDERYFESRFLVYHMKLKTVQLSLHDSSMVFALALIFFGHNFKLFKENEMVVIELSPKIRFTCPDSLALLIKELRQRLDQLLEYKVAHPGSTDWNEGSDEGKLLRAIAELISHEDQKLTMMDDSDEDDDDDDDDETDGSYEDQSRGAHLNFSGSSKKDWRADSSRHSQGSNYQNHSRGGFKRNTGRGRGGEGRFSGGFRGNQSNRSNCSGRYDQAGPSSSTSGVTPFPRF